MMKLACAALLLSCVPALADLQAVRDIYSAPYTGETVVVVGTIPAYIGRGFKAKCSAAGTITFTYQDGTSGQWDVAATTQVLPVALALLTATSATCTYANLK